MLCNTCRTLLETLQKSTTQRTEILHHACTADVRSAIANGCPICSRLDVWDVNNEDGEADWYINTMIRWYFPDWDAIDLTFVSRRIGGPDNTFSSGPYTGNLRLIQVDADQDRLHIPGYCPSNIVGDVGSLAMARMWIKTCEEHHTLCKRPPVEDDPNWRPTRLIYVGEDDTQLRLVHGSALPDDIEYATLSHCWGKLDSRLVLMEANLNAWCERLPALDHWKTFADAVQITRQLGFSFIWIDSLCIIQDSLTDWQGECPQMCNVYRRSVLNIAATSAADDTIGCLLNRDVDAKLPVRIHFGIPSDHVDHVDHAINIIAASQADGSLHGAYDMCNDHTWFNDIKGSVLNSRGWVLQERMISPRVLNFTRSQMYWECSELRASESCPYGVPYEGNADINFKFYNPFHLKNEENEDIFEHAMEIWARAVRAYTEGNEFDGVSFARNITKASDKLVAFSAIARELQPYIGCRYVAGQWERDLVRQLPWRTGHGGERPDEYRAPSWSWASVDALMRDFAGLYGHNDEQYPYGSEEGNGRTWKALVDIDKVEVELETGDPMGQVKSGFLQLRGKLLQVRVVFAAGKYRFEEPTPTVSINDRSTSLTFYEDVQSKPTGEPYHLFCLPTGITFTKKFTKIVNLDSLMLEQTETRGTYRRVGILGLKIVQERVTRDLANDPIVQAFGLRREGPSGRMRVDLDDPDMETITIV